MATTTSAEAILRAARRARQAAELHVTHGEASDAEALFHAIREAESSLKAATARIRQSQRPLSVSGLGESHDRAMDAFDDLALASERLEREFPEDDDDQSEREWEEFLDAHPELDEAEVPSRALETETEAFLDVAAFTDDEIVAAVAKACKVNRYGRGTFPPSSSDVVLAIAPNHKLVYPKNRAGTTMASPTALRMAQRLAKLAKAGRIVRHNRKWGGAKAWAIAGFRPTDECAYKWHEGFDA